MNVETKTFFKVFTAWQDDREEAWLREKAREGWHLVKPGIGYYIFQRGPLQDIVYRMDYNNMLSASDRQEYFDLFSQAGWELVGEVLGWLYFRKPASAGVADEIYTDNQSKISKLRRQMTLMFIVLMPNIINLANYGHLPTRERLGSGLITLFAACVAALLCYGLLRTWQRVRALRKL